MTFFKKPLSGFSFGKGGFYASGEGDSNACSLGGDVSHR
jgi:hypothetical protein